MFPVLGIGPLHLSTYSLLYAVAMCCGGMLAFRRLVRAGLDVAAAIGVLVAAIAAAMAGSRLFFWAMLRVLPSAESGPHHVGGGSTEFGALLFGAAAAYLYCRLRRFEAGIVLDALFGAVPLAQAIGRLGCFAAGCCYGKPASSWLAMYLPGEAGRWEPRYPAQLLTSVVDAVIFVILVSIERRWRSGDRPNTPAGVLTATYFQLHLLSRFLLEFIRDERPLLRAPFSWAHGVAAAGFMMATLFAWRLRARAVNRP